MILALLLSVAGEVRVLRPEIAPERIAAWRAAPEEIPSLRGFVAPILDRADGTLALHPPADVDARAARIVAERLAPNGLRATLVDALLALEPRAESVESARARLAAIGLPTDLFACHGDALERAHHGVRAGRARDEIVGELTALAFAWEPAVSGFALATECGEHDAAAVRLAVSSASDYARPGEGGALDVLRGFARALPDAEIVATVESKHVAGVEAESRALAGARSSAITVVESQLPIAQWAQDAAKPGFVGERVVWLAPRYASRGEAGSRFVPAESLALEGFAATGRDVRVSRLLFQGGNLLAVRDPRDGKRTLLVGEAEVARNRALGLALDEVLAAFRAEFGVDSCVVLPAVSFHVDLEITARATPDGVVACVLDTSTAVRTVIHCGVAALERASFLDAAAAHAAREAVDGDRYEDFFTAVGPALQKGMHAGGRVDLEFADALAASPEDSGVGLVHRLLLALDLWTAARIGDAPADVVGLDVDTHAYLQSLRRRELDRLRVAQALESLGWRLVPVPGLSDETRSLNPLNGIQLPGRFLVPAYGGSFAALDDLARARLAEAFGPEVAIQPIPCAETQRRAGGLHCAASIEPRAAR